MLGNQIVSQELMDMGNRVRQFRNKRRWSQEKLAEEVDISLNTVSRIECGQTRMSIEVFMRLVQALDVDAELLLFGKIPDRRKRDDTRIQFLMQGLKKVTKRYFCRQWEHWRRISRSIGKQKEWRHR